MSCADINADGIAEVMYVQQKKGKGKFVVKDKERKKKGKKKKGKRKKNKRRRGSSRKYELWAKSFSGKTLLKTTIQKPQGLLAADIYHNGIKVPGYYRNLDGANISILTFFVPGQKDPVEIQFVPSNLLFAGRFRAKDGQLYDGVFGRGPAGKIFSMNFKDYVQIDHGITVGETSLIGPIHFSRTKL